MLPVMKCEESESLRKKVYEGSCSIGHSGEFKNNDILLRIAKLRDKKAKLLGFSSFADLVLMQRMESNGNNALHFVDDLHDKARAQFIQEIDCHRQYKEKVTGDDNNAEILLREKYDFDVGSLRPYFPVDKVMHCVFSSASTLYGTNVKEKQTFYRQTVAYSIEEGKNRRYYSEQFKFFS